MDSAEANHCGDNEAEGLTATGGKTVGMRVDVPLPSKGLKKYSNALIQWVDVDREP